MSSAYVSEVAEASFWEISLFEQTLPHDLTNDIWQFEQTNLHNGTWTQISVRSDSPFYGTNPDYLPPIVSSDSEGIARIITGKFEIEWFQIFSFGEGGTNRYAIIRYEEWTKTILLISIILHVCD